jgi:hypothetical protein
MKNIEPYSTEDKLPPFKTVNEIDFSAIYSYADYMRFEFEERLEIIKGRVFRMNSAPSHIQQGVLTNIFGQYIIPCKENPVAFIRRHLMSA